MPRPLRTPQPNAVGSNGPNGTGIGCRFEKRWIGHRRTVTTTDRTWDSIRPSGLPLSWYLGSSRRSRQSSRSRSGFDFIGLHAASEKITNSQVRNRLRRSENRRRAPSGTLAGENRMVCPHRPPLPTSRPISFAIFYDLRAFFRSGLLRLSIPDSMQSKRPLPRPSPINLYFFFSSLRAARILFPMFSEFACRFPLDCPERKLQHFRQSVKVKPVRERLRNYWSCHYRPRRATVADSFGHCHDIGNYVLHFKSPLVDSGSTKSRLASSAMHKLPAARTCS